jgi:hypothetical protein
MASQRIEELPQDEEQALMAEFFDTRRYVTTRKAEGTNFLSEDELLVLKYTGDQPRHPKGSSQGGQWMKGGPDKAIGASVDSFVDSMFGEAGIHPGESEADWLERREPLDTQAAYESDGDALVRALGGNPEDIIQRLVDRQEVFEKDIKNRGIRVDAQLEGEQYPMEEFTKMLDFFPDHSIEHFVRKEGEPFTVPDRPPQIDIMEPKQCFMNCAKKTAMTFSDDEKYDYVEGYVIDTKLPFPIHHAWLVERGTDKVADPTMGWRPTAAYYGVRMSRTYVRRKLVENGYYGILTDGMRPNDIVLGTDEDFDYK